MGYVEGELIRKLYEDQTEIVEKWRKGEDLPNILA
jgi:hypothetical protein